VAMFCAGAGDVLALQTPGSIELVAERSS
jgi:hypothetical protein